MTKATKPNPNTIFPVPNIKTVTYIKQTLKKVEHLAVAQNNGDYLGFMGVEQHRLEMLFLDPRYIGQGIGHKMVEYGAERYQIDEVTVNEQNPQAVRFYEHLGFNTYKRTATDEQGRPFPLLYMKI
jgi:putative acetyltransferase